MLVMFEKTQQSWHRMLSQIKHPYKVLLHGNDQDRHISNLTSPKDLKMSLLRAGLVKDYIDIP
jgi:hypothetical protein